MDGDKLTLVWEKSMPEGLAYNCYKYTTPSRKLIMSWACMFVFDGNLTLLSKYPLPGQIRGMWRDEYFVVCDWFTDDSKNSGELRIRKRKLSAPRQNMFTFSIPAEGAYRRDDALLAACAEDGSTAIVARRQRYADFYCPTGQCIIIMQKVI